MSSTFLLSFGKLVVVVVVVVHKIGPAVFQSSHHLISLQRLSDAMVAPFFIYL